MSNTNESKNLPSVQLVENQEWKTVEVNGDEMSIPTCWNKESIHTLFEVSMGVTILSKNTRPQPSFGSIPVYSATEKNIVFGYVDESIIPPSKKLNAGDMVLGARGSLGFPKKVQATSTSTQTTIQLKTKNTCNTDFVLHSLNSKNKQLFGGAGSGVPMLTVRDVAQIEISLPELNEQTLIAQVLTAQESQVHDLRKLAQAERQRLTWLSEELLSGRLRVEEDPTAESVVVSRNEKGEPVEVLPGVRVVENRKWKTVEVNGKEKLIPDEWMVKNVGESIDFKLGNTPPKTGSNYDGNTPWVTISNISGALTTSCTAKIDYEKARVLPKGSLIGSFKMSVGRFSILGMDAATNEAIVGVSPDGAPGFSFDYLRFALVEPFVGGASTNGQGVHLLNTKTIKSLSFVAPPLPEQTLIAQVLTAQETQASELERLADLEQKRLEWLSDELLSGRIRVRAVDAEDEQENTP